MTLRAGDIVRHLPSGETWQLGAVSEDGREVIPNGWPETIANTIDCSLVERSPDSVHVEQVQGWRKRGPDAGLRRSWNAVHRCPLCLDVFEEQSEAFVRGELR